MNTTRIVLLSSTLDLSFLAAAFRAAAPELDVVVGLPAAGEVEADVAVCWNPAAGTLGRVRELQLIQSISAGVDHVLTDTSRPDAVPVCRIVDPGMAASMAAWVTWAVIHQQRHFPDYLASAARREWREQPIRSPHGHRVGIAGLGWLGSTCAGALRAIGYDVRGWRRTALQPAPAGVALFHGDDQLDDFLAGCDTLVCLLPLTAATRGILGARLFERLPRGAHLVHAGRGDHLNEADLLTALDAGQLASATLDVFSQEPLPPAHPFWRHPRVVVTPHIASRTDLQQIVRQTLDNLARIRRGQTPTAAVDTRRGY